MWVYSFLYNNLAREQKYLDVAGKTAEFILKNAPEGDEFFYSEFTREGTPVGERGSLLDRHLLAPLDQPGAGAARHDLVGQGSQGVHRAAV